MKITGVIDVIHVLDYLWTAAFTASSLKVIRVPRHWVRQSALAILDRGARDVAAGIRRRASSERLKAVARNGADDCAQETFGRGSRLWLNRKARSRRLASSTPGVSYSPMRAPRLPR
jgi:hypothetical protein